MGRDRGGGAQRPRLDPPSRRNRGVAHAGPRGGHVPRRVAGDDRRDDAAVDVADAVAVRGRGCGPSSSAARQPGRRQRLSRRLDRFRRARVDVRPRRSPHRRSQCVAHGSQLDRCGCHVARGRGFPVHAAARTVHACVPSPRRLPDASLPAGVALRVRTRSSARPVLPRLLLGADAADVRCGAHQPGVDGCTHRGDGLYEKVGRRGEALARGVGVVLLLWGALVAVQPAWLPHVLSGRLS